ncbi:MAG: HDOD domain-containing protein [Candidatus Acidiferrales bacterium]
MKRVLFVDDEPEILRRIERMLDPQREQWEMAYAAGGEAALSLMGTAPFDVVVSDMRMPGVDGAVLLQAVCEQFPSVVRIVLASQAEMEGALRAVPVAHQFLLKPCDPNMLRVSIERATSLSNILSNKLLASLVGSVKDLPVLPRTYMALREKLASPNAPLREIVGLVEQDVSICAKILQLVNSALFGLPREISTVQSAVTYLGIEMVQNLVLSSEVFSVFEKVEMVPGFSFEEMQAHSQLVAKIATLIRAPAHVHGAAVVAALLHDVGKLVLAMRSPQNLARALSGAAEEKKPQYEIEEGLMGVSHAEVGAYLLGIWGLPCPVVESVAHHHRPDRIPHDKLDAVGIVHIANCLAHKHGGRLAADDAPVFQSVDPEFLERLELAEDFADWDKMAEKAAKDMHGSRPGKNQVP